VVHPDANPGFTSRYAVSDRRGVSSWVVESLCRKWPARNMENTVCIANISTSERRKRLMFGLIQLAFGLVILAALIATGVSRWWRLPLLLVFWVAAIGFFQWLDKT
jgi:hypothetical protein